ncbi:MAG: dihydrofolate reductase [Patescibacteria group bacterium]
MISLIAAMGKNRVIGKGGALPWKLPADMKRFRKLTSGHPVIMGRKTCESIGRPLPNRMNIIVTLRAGYSAPGCEIVSSLEEGISRARLAAGSDEIFIIGGGEIYKQAIDRDLAEKIYLTVIDKDFDGDAYFPEIDESKWKLVKREERELDTENAYHHSFLIFEHTTRYT